MATEPKPQDEYNALVPPSRHITFETFLDWMDEDTHAEWVDGEVVMTSPASTRHQDILGFLFELMRGYNRWQKLGRVSVAPTQTRLARSSREPDIVFVTNDHLDRLRPTFLDGPADLVVEIVSPESVDRDYHIKFAEYAAAGIPEYWIIDPDANRVLFYHLDAGGQYALSPLQGGQLHSRILPGFWLDPAWLAQNPLPDEEEMLLQVGGQLYRDYLLRRLGQP